MTSRSSSGAVRQLSLGLMADSKKASVLFEGTCSLQNGKSQHDVHSYANTQTYVADVTKHSEINTLYIQ